MFTNQERLQVLSRSVGSFAALDHVAAAAWLARNPILPTPEAATERRAAKRSGVTAVLPLFGYLTPHASPLEEMLGATSTARWSQVFGQLVEDEQVGTIILDVDSPGGDVTGMQALSEQVYQARRTKPIYAVSNGLNASAAYGISSAARQVIADPDSLTGSVGVVYEHVDMSEALAREGVKVEYITFGQYKAELSPGQPLSDEAREYLQGITDSYGEDFVRRVATNRGISQAKVKADFGQGRVMRAKDAVITGMADRVGTLHEVVSGLGNASSESAMAAESPIEPFDTEGRGKRWQQIQTDLALNLPERRARRGAAA